jgi:hypothetical protein
MNQRTIRIVAIILVGALLLGLLAGVVAAIVGA